MIVLIGVGHVFNIGRSIKNEILVAQPEVVCVELDQVRAEALLHQKKSGSLTEKNVPLIYQMLAVFQKIIATKFETEPGTEMIAAIEVARELNAKIEYIDIDAVTVAERIWREMSFVERAKLISGLFFGIFLTRKNVEKHINEFMTAETEIIDAFGREFPTLKKILIEDRNDYMAWRISLVSKEYTNIVCVVGEGHIDGISKKLSSRNLPHRIVNLKQLLKDTNAELTWSWVW